MILVERLGRILFFDARNKLHRAGGMPATIGPSGEKNYYEHGTCISILVQAIQERRRHKGGNK